MLSSDNPTPTIFTAENEPYRDLKVLHEVDKLLARSLERTGIAAEKAHSLELSALQQMASCVVPQAISLALSIRELIRQGYIFGAFVLIRPLAERAAILLYLQHAPADITKWQDGWHHGTAPSFTQMMDSFRPVEFQEANIRAKDITGAMNALVHGKPESAVFNLTAKPEEPGGHAWSRLLARPDLCETAALQLMSWLSVVDAMTFLYFSTEAGKDKPKPTSSS